MKAFPLVREEVRGQVVWLHTFWGLRISTRRFGLLLSFPNPERVSPPDFDIDFCMPEGAKSSSTGRSTEGIVSPTS